MESSKKIKKGQIENYVSDATQASLDTKIDKVTGKSLIADTEIARLLTLSNFDNSANVTALNLKADKNITQIRVNASTTIDASWNGAIVIITAPGVVLTVPTDLPVITFDAITRPGATCNFALTSPKVWVNGTPTIVPEKSTFVFVVDNLNSNEVYVSEPIDISLKANIDSPSFTGTPTAPTPTEGTNNNEIATTAFVFGNPVIPTLQQVLDFNHDLINDNNFQGTKAGQGNTGNSVNAFGDSAGQNNSGSSVNALGNKAGQNNSGSSVNALGNAAGVNNTFDNVNLFGDSAQADASTQTVFSKNIFVMARISYINLKQTRKYELPDADGTFALVENSVQQGVNNNTTLALTSAQLNLAYPIATTGFKVYCTGIIAGKMTYEKTPTGWIGYTVLIP